MFEYSKKLKVKYSVLIFFSILLSVLNGISSYFNKTIIDIITYKKDLNLVIIICVSILITYVLISIIDIFKSYIHSKVINNLNYGIKSIFFDIIQKSTYISNIANESSEIYYRIFYDIDTISSYFIELVVSLPVSIVSFLLYLIIMLSWSIELTCFVIIISLIQIIVSNYIKPIIKKNTELVIKNETDFVKEVGEHFRGIETVKVLGIEKYKLNIIEEIIKKIKKTRIKKIFVLSVLNFLTGFIGQICSIGLLLIGSFMIFKGDISIGTYIGFNSIMGMFSNSINNIISLIFNFEETSVSYRRFKEFSLNYSEYEYEGYKEFVFKKELEIKNLKFSYDNTKTIFNSLNIKLFPGDFVGLKGESGTGKSTLGKLLMRLIKPSDGNILIDNVDIKMYTSKSYKQSVAYLSQLPFIFNGSIKDNIFIGNENIDYDYLEYLLDRTGLRQIIDKLPNGINTIIGGDGAILSVGEAQRICITRILLKKPRIIILDEPTSALNSKLDDLVSNLFKEYAKKFNSLVILISHKDNTLKNVDYLYDINNLKNYMEKRNVCE